MKSQLAKPLIFVSFLITSLFTIHLLPDNSGTNVIASNDLVSESALHIISPEGESIGFCPLKHTEVKAEVSGFISRVNVTQEFENKSREKIEAVYTFPLPRTAAVDDMTMHIGKRVIKGKILKREEARTVYENAKSRGHVASLLDQERPNIFTQSVANIMPGEKIKISISYVDYLKYEDGLYEFVFPTVVGPRYIPGNATGKQAGGWANDTDQVPDASRITPPVARPGTRSGHDISIQVSIDAGLPLKDVRSTSHDVDITKDNENALVKLRNSNTIPNKDFILRYQVAGKGIEEGVLSHRGDRGGFFSLILQPPARVSEKDVTPKELVFVIDTSGSMHGFPLDKAKETMNLAFDGLNPQDTFNLITFAGDTEILFREPVPATMENLRRAREFLESRKGGGGTEMMKAIRAALDPSDSQSHIRIVCFMTDGYVGNDMEIISEIQKHQNARIFSFGIGSSVNRFLLDKMAEEGRGEVEYVSLNDDGSAAAKRFHERVRNPLLTDITIDWGGLPVTEVYPSRIPDLFSAKPLVVSGRYNNAAEGSIRLRGKVAGLPFEREVQVRLPDREKAHDVLSTLWAREKIENLMAKDFSGLQRGNPAKEISEAITQLGLDFRLMTQFTSFVAVEESIITEGGKPRRVDVPVEMPHGVSYNHIFGDAAAASPRAMYKSAMVGNAAGGAGVVLTEQASNAVIAPEASLDMMRSEARNTRVHAQLVRLIESVRKGNSSGRVQIEITLSEKSPDVIKQLQKAGLVILSNPAATKKLVGVIAAKQLETLLKVQSITYIAPKS